MTLLFFACVLALQRRQNSDACNKGRSLDMNTTRTTQQQNNETQVK